MELNGIYKAQTVDSLGEGRLRLSSSLSFGMLDSCMCCSIGRRVFKKFRLFGGEGVSFQRLGPV